MQPARKIRSVLLDGIEGLVRDKNCSYIDATIMFCEFNNIDLEHAAAIISNNAMMTTKIHTEANELNFLKK